MATSYPHLRGLLSVPAARRWWSPRSATGSGARCATRGSSRRAWPPRRGRRSRSAGTTPTATDASPPRRSPSAPDGGRRRGGRRDRPGASLILRSRAGWSLDVPVNGLAAALASGFLVYHALTVGVKRHHVVIWGAVLAAGLLPVWGGLDLGDTSNAGLARPGSLRSSQGCSTTGCSCAASA